MSDNQLYTLSKSERLNSDKAINELFTDGKSFVKFPLRVVYRKREDVGTACRILISVPKKRFKRAVKRNRIKRLVRESYRLNKSLVLNSLVNETVDIAFVYIDSKLSTFTQIQQSVKGALSRIASTAESNG